MKSKIKKALLTSALMISGLSVLTTQTLEAHCQVPCGIYDDTARINSMLEDAQTVAKATKLINELAGKTDAQSQNQITRWVLNKEKHAQSIISTISDYFLTQRVKTSQKDYTERLTKHHAVILAAMKAKQLANAASAEALDQSIEALSSYYVEKKHKEH